jgi:hypothetical protein
MRFGALRKRDPPSAKPADSASGAAAAAASVGSDAAPLPPPTTNEVLQTAIDVRADGIQALKRVEANARLAEESGAASMATLSKNNEVLTRAETIAERIDARSAKKELVSMARQLSRDKCFVTLAVISCLLIVLVIVLPLVRPRDPESNLVNAAAPQPPPLSGNGTNAKYDGKCLVI